MSSIIYKLLIRLNIVKYFRMFTLSKQRQLLINGKIKSMYFNDYTMKYKRTSVGEIFHSKTYCSVTIINIRL